MISVNRGYLGRVLCYTSLFSVAVDFDEAARRWKGEHDNFKWNVAFRNWAITHSYNTLGSLFYACWCLGEEKCL